MTRTISGRWIFSFRVTIKSKNAQEIKRVKGPFFMTSKIEIPPAPIKKLIWSSHPLLQNGLYRAVCCRRIDPRCLRRQGDPLRHPHGQVPVWQDGCLPGADPPHASLRRDPACLHPLRLERDRTSGAGHQGHEEGQPGLLRV